MELRKINWSQINSVPTSGSTEGMSYVSRKQNPITEPGKYSWGGSVLPLEISPTDLEIISAFSRKEVEGLVVMVEYVLLEGEKVGVWKIHHFE